MLQTRQTPMFLIILFLPHNEGRVLFLPVCNHRCGPVQDGLDDTHWYGRRRWAISDPVVCDLTSKPLGLSSSRVR